MKAVKKMFNEVKFKWLRTKKDIDHITQFADLETSSKETS